MSTFLKITVKFALDALQLFAAPLNLLSHVLSDDIRFAGNKRLNVAIYGATEAGMKLLELLRQSSALRPAAVFDDRPDTHGKRVDGLEVQSPENLRSILSAFEVKRVILAMPAASAAARRVALSRLEGLKVHVQTLPKEPDLEIADVSVERLVDIGIEDLLYIDPMSSRSDLLEASIKGRNVMVTGAGGLLGAEICRQVIDLCPARLLFVDHSESALAVVAQDLERIRERLGIKCTLVPRLTSLLQNDILTAIMRANDIDTIYHAAAYKNIWLTERDIVDATCNNVFGTLHVAQAAKDCRVKTFVIVSTDKAALPRNIVNATRRLAEMVVQAFGAEGTETHFSIIRLGNMVTNSSSIVNLWRKQIENGFITITDPDMTRYFIPVSEAIRLLIQAGALGGRGEVFGFDMGEPVRIGDLAKRFIDLMGLSDAVRILYVGTRPGEVLHEAPAPDGSAATEHPRIWRASERNVPWGELVVGLDQLRSAIGEANENGLKRILLQLVPEYEPSSGPYPVRDPSSKPDQFSEFGSTERFPGVPKLRVVG